MRSLRSETRRDGSVCCAYCTYPYPILYTQSCTCTRNVLCSESGASYSRADMHPRSSVSRERTVKLVLQETELHRSFVSGKGGGAPYHGRLPCSRLLR